MTAPSTANELSDQLDREFNWRRVEMSSLKTLFKRAEHRHRDAIGRAAIVALYAHWEGFVREAVQLYLHHVSCRSLTLDQLPIGMMFAWHPSALAHAQNSGSNPILKVALVQELTNLRRWRARNQKPEIDTRANLALKVLEEIDCLFGNLGLADGIDRVWLDEKLVKKRNTIAHGRSSAVEFGEFTELLDQTTSWMQAITNKLVNAALQETYRISAR
jgi:hypothetical protein